MTTIRIAIEAELLQANNAMRCNLGNLRAVQFSGQFNDTLREQDYWAEALAQSRDEVAKIEHKLTALN